MRVVNYYRVSTKLQQDRFSLLAQKNELRNYVKKQNWTLVNEFVDVETGGKLDKEGLSALLDLVETGEVDAVLCMDQDRLSRLDTVSWEYLKNELRESGVKIAEPNGTITDLSNEDQEFMSDLRNLIAQREKKMVVKRMMYGKRQRLREGKGWGICPFEYYYDKEKSFYFVKKGWEWTIPFIDDLYLNKNLGMKNIANELNKISKTPTGNQWNEHLIHTRLTSKTFHGYQEMTFSNGETISANVYEPMRTKETYDKIQEKRKARSRVYGVHKRISTKNIDLLKFVPITCGYCGRTISVQQHGTSKHPKFVAYHGRSRTIDGNRCDISINVKRYEYNLVKALNDILKNEELASKYINLEKDTDDLYALKKEKDNIAASYKKMTESRDKLLDLYLTSDISKDVYLNKNNELKNKIKKTKEMLDQLERKIKSIQKEEWNYENLKSYLRIVSDFGTRLTRHEQAKVIGDIFTKAVLTNEHLVLTTELYNNIPIDITVNVVNNTWTVNKWMRRDLEKGKVIYTF